MNLLDFSNGGIRLSLDDLDFIHDTHREAFAALHNHLGGNVILHGCTVTEDATYIYVGAGYCVINNEMCKVDAQTVEKLTYTVADFSLTINQQATGSHTLVDGGTQNVRIIRKAVVSNTTLVPATYKIELSKVSDFTVAKLLRPVTESTYSFLNGASTSFLNPLKIKKEGKLVKFQGLLSCHPSDPDGEDFVNIQSGFRPPIDMAFGVFLDFTHPIAMVLVKPDGNILVKLGTNKAITIDLSGVSYFIV